MSEEQDVLGQDEINDLLSSIGGGAEEFINEGVESGAIAESEEAGSEAAPVYRDRETFLRESPMARKIRPKLQVLLASGRERLDMLDGVVDPALFDSAGVAGMEVELLTEGSPIARGTIEKRDARYFLTIKEMLP